MEHFKDFEDFLQDKFIRQNPTVLDDDIPDAFSDWLGDIEVDLWLEYGDEYAKAVSHA